MNNREHITAAIVDSFFREGASIPNLTGFLRSFVTLLKEVKGSARLFVCGGLVRDLSIAAVHHYPVQFKDVDLVVEGISGDALRDFLAHLKTECGVLHMVEHVGRAFPVWKLKIGGYADTIDLAQVRTEISTGAGHCDFALTTEGVSVEDDSRRRDFTINALYIEITADDKGTLSGEVIDFHGSLQSIAEREIRCVGSAYDRFLEDPLRILRAVRFETKLTGFRIEKSTASAMKELVPTHLSHVSIERITDEMYRSLKSNPRLALLEYRNYGILAEIVPELSRPGDELLETAIRRIEAACQRAGDNIDSPVLFAALLLDFALQDLDVEMRRSLSSLAMPVRLCSQLPTVHRIARELRLPNMKEVKNVCADVLALMHFDMLRYADATLETVLRDAEKREAVLTVYGAACSAAEKDVFDFGRRNDNLCPAAFDFKALTDRAGIPPGPHLYEMKLALRQAEIEGVIKDEAGADAYLRRLSLHESVGLREHVTRIMQFVKSDSCRLPVDGELGSEVRRHLYADPQRLLQAYSDAKLLYAVFPELAEADRMAGTTEFHYLDSYMGHVMVSLSHLYSLEENPDHSHILAVIFQDIGKTQTMKTDEAGKVTFHNHDIAGATMSRRICARLGVAQEVEEDVYFIIRNHNALVSASGINRARKLLDKVDRSLIDDLLLVHRVGQTAKRRITFGQQTDGGELDNYNHIISNIDTWESEKRTRDLDQRQRITPLLSGADLMSDNPAWGSGLPEGALIGSLKRHLLDLQDRGLIETRQEAIESVRGSIVLHNLAADAVSSTGKLFDAGMLGGILPEIAALVELEQTGPYHSEDVYRHTLNVLAALPRGSSVELVVAALFHDTGKALTRSYDAVRGVYHFYGHEKESVILFNKAAQRLNWTELDWFNADKVDWLIGSHMKLLRRSDQKSQAKRTIRNLLFLGKDGGIIQDHYRDDLLALVSADNRGAEPADSRLKEERIELYRQLLQLVDEVRREMMEEDREREILRKVQSVWNGRSVLKYFQVTGPEVGCLLRLGQDFVRRSMASGISEVTEQQVLDYIKAESAQ